MEYRSVLNPVKGEEKKLVQLAIICSVVTLLRITTLPRSSDGRSV